MSDLKKAREIEDRRWFKLINRLNEEEQDQITRVKAEAAARGVYQSGKIGIMIARAMSEKMKRMVDGRIEIRKELATKFPELGTEESINEVLTKLNEMLANAFAGLRQGVPQDTSPQVASAFDFRNDLRARQVQAYATSEFEILKREMALDLYTKTERVTSLSVNTGGGNAVVNLGNVYGDVQQLISNVRETGCSELASALGNLAEAIREAEGLREERATYLEQIRFIAEQATVVVDSRQTGVVKGLASALRTGLQDVANFAQVLAIAGPAIARHFGFQWPI